MSSYGMYLFKKGYKGLQNTWQFPILPMRTFYKTWMAHKNRVHIETIETINIIASRWWQYSIIFCLKLLKFNNKQHDFLPLT